MSPEERQLLQGLFDRMRPNANAPRDQEAEQMIADNVRQQPYAPYLLSQTVIIQDQALQAANDKIQHLEEQMRERPGSAQGGGGFLSGLFGGGAAPSYQPPPQRPVWNQGGAAPGAYPPGNNYPPQQGGPWGGAPQQSEGGGFLRGALGTAAGVAGGVLMADSIRSLFGGGHGLGGLGIASGVPGMGGDSAALRDADRAQDALQDANDAYDTNGPTAADWRQDVDQDQDEAQDAGDYSDDV